MATGHMRGMGATYIPGGGFDDYYDPPPAPELVAPEPQRINPEMSNQIQDGLQNMKLNSRNYSELTGSHPQETPHLSPFPKLHNSSPNIPPSDEELEATLENARSLVLSSNDPEMQLAWASDALVYAGVSADNEERIAAAKPHAARSATPRIEHVLKTDSMNIVTFLADQHHPKAEFLRGMWLEWGRFGQREDKKEAFRCYSRAADRGYARAEYRIGMLYESYNDPVKALRHYHRGVDAGDAASCYRLGMMTLRGQHGQQKDFAKGIELIRKSAEAADENAAQGAYVYGMLLARQLPQIEVLDGGLPYDERQAKINIEKAAYLKFAKAQVKMGSAYELGSLGCEFNPALSMHYNALASKQGEAEADMALSKWFLVGSEGLFPKNEELAYTYAERAAQASLPTAEFAMGYFHEIGMYVSVDLDKAVEWYQKASKHGNEDARGRIEGLSRKQVLSRKDHENVAISRIKSQYGSQRGVRPERFRNNAQQRPGQSPIAEEQMSPSGRYNGSAMSNSGSIQSPPPPRGDSITPYPMDNRPPTVNSPAPYPLEDGPPKPGPRLGPAGGFFNTAQPPRPATTIDRPSSAFQFNPDMRSTSASTVPQLPSQQQGQTPYGPPGPRDRTAQPQQPYGQRPQPRQRIAGGPAAGGPLPQNYPPPSGPQQHLQGPPRPGMMQHQYTAPPGLAPNGGLPSRQSPAPGTANGFPPRPPPTQSPRLDIGFSAPPESGGRRTHGRQPQQQQQQNLPQSGSMPNLDPPGPLPGSGVGGRSSAPPARPGSARPAPAPSVASTGTGGSGSTGTSGSVGSGVGGASGPAKKMGPKTFDEMGVPAQKRDQECVVM